MAYGLPDPRTISYVVSDTITIGIEALGQSLDLQVRSVATYALAFERAADRLRATLAIEDLDAEVSAPMGGPMRVDESVVSGSLVVDVDRRGDLAVVASPEVEEAAAAYFSGPQVAAALFPGVLGAVARQGDSWVDTVSSSETGDTGEASQQSILTYTVVGEVTEAGRTLLQVAFEGPSEMRQTMSMQGIDIEQSTDMALEGRLLWDVQRGLIQESETVGSGTGTVRISAMPGSLPTRVEIRQRVRSVLP